MTGDSGVIRVSGLVKHRLEKFRDDRAHGSMDSAIRELFIQADVDIYEYKEEYEQELQTDEIIEEAKEDEEEKTDEENEDSEQEKDKTSEVMDGLGADVPDF